MELTICFFNYATNSYRNSLLKLVRKNSHLPKCCAHCVGVGCDLLQRHARLDVIAKKHEACLAGRARGAPKQTVLDLVCNLNNLILCRFYIYPEMPKTWKFNMLVSELKTIPIFYLIFQVYTFGPRSLTCPSCKTSMRIDKCLPMYLEPGILLPGSRTPRIPSLITRSLKQNIVLDKY